MLSMLGLFIRQLGQLVLGSSNILQPAKREFHLKVHVHPKPYLKPTQPETFTPSNLNPKAYDLNLDPKAEALTAKPKAINLKPISLP